MSGSLSDTSHNPASPIREMWTRRSAFAAWRVDVCHTGGVASRIAYTKRRLYTIYKLMPILRKPAVTHASKYKHAELTSSSAIVERPRELGDYKGGGSLRG